MVPRETIELWSYLDSFIVPSRTPALGLENGGNSGHVNP